MVNRPCIFCSILEGKLPSAQVYKDADFMVIMDKYPINRGHALVIPTKHYDNLLQMPPAEVGRLYSMVPAVAKAVVSAVGADGFNVGQNNGIAANQIVPHVHVHIVPRFIDDSPDGRWPDRRVAQDGELAELAQKIRLKMAAAPSSK
ncbi:HIT family protein [Nitrososphaera sp.]|uniref:HIT family protein n=1 Tax=Nitrososphaera sp. TaxID=1971748 RepID=UPI00307FA444